MRDILTILLNETEQKNRRRETMGKGCFRLWERTASVQHMPALAVSNPAGWDKLKMTIKKTGVPAPARDRSPYQNPINTIRRTA